MKFARATILALVAAAATPAFAHDHHEISCDMHSDYKVQLAPDALRFERSDPGTRIELRQGALLVDGKAVKVSDADREKLQRFEQELRAMLPEARAIALEAIDIAYSAVEHVMRTFASDSASADRSIARLESDRKAMRAKLEAQAGTPWFDEREFERLVESTVASVVPEVVGDVTAAAVKAALSGDEHAVEEIERKAERMEKEIERDVEAKADALGMRAEKLCPRLTELDRIESSLSVRLADGRPLNLLETRH